MQGGLAQYFLEELTGVRAGGGRHLLRRPRRDDGTATITTLGAEVDEIIGRFDDVHVVLDDQHGIPVVHQTAEHFQ